VPISNHLALPRSGSRGDARAAASIALVRRSQPGPLIGPLKPPKLRSPSASRTSTMRLVRSGSLCRADGVDAAFGEKLVERLQRCRPCEPADQRAGAAAEPGQGQATFGRATARQSCSGRSLAGSTPQRPEPSYWPHRNRARWGANTGFIRQGKGVSGPAMAGFTGFIYCFK